MATKLNTFGAFVNQRDNLKRSYNDFAGAKQQQNLQGNTTQAKQQASTKAATEGNNVTQATNNLQVDFSNIKAPVASAPAYSAAVAPSKATVGNDRSSVADIDAGEKAVRDAREAGYQDFLKTTAADREATGDYYTQRAGVANTAKAGTDAYLTDEDRKSKTYGNVGQLSVGETQSADLNNQLANTPGTSNVGLLGKFFGQYSPYDVRQAGRLDSSLAQGDLNRMRERATGLNAQAAGAEAQRQSSRQQMLGNIASGKTAASNFYDNLQGKEAAAKSTALKAIADRETSAGQERDRYNALDHAEAERLKVDAPYKEVRRSIVEGADKVTDRASATAYLRKAHDDLNAARAKYGKDDGRVKDLEGQFAVAYDKVVNYVAGAPTPEAAAQPSSGPSSGYSGLSNIQKAGLVAANSTIAAPVVLAKEAAPAVAKAAKKFSSWIGG